MMIAMAMHMVAVVVVMPLALAHNHRRRDPMRCRHDQFEARRPMPVLHVGVNVRV